MSEDNENKKSGLTVGGVSGSKKMRLGRVHKKKTEETPEAPVAAPVAEAPAPAPAATPQEAQETIVLELPDQQPQRSVSANFLDADNDGVPDSPDNTVIR